MTKADQIRITLLALMGMSVGETLDEKYEDAQAMLQRFQDDGVFGGTGKSTGQSKPSKKQASSSQKRKTDDLPATKRQVQRVLDASDEHDAETLEAMTQAEIRSLLKSLE